jgi:teichuronic acid biosynthesis glycosyltransferase TuaC
MDSKIKILFIYRYYGSIYSNSVLEFQKQSLINNGLDIGSYCIEKGRIFNYLKYIWRFKKYLKKHNFEIIHAHYSFCGFIAGLASQKPVICSLMGSDLLLLGKIHLQIVRLFSKFVWKTTIVKTREMNKLLPKSLIIPNGIDTIHFKEIEKAFAMQRTGFNEGSKHILFLAQAPDSMVKNIGLTKQAINLLNDNEIDFHVVSGKSLNELPYYYNSADLLLITSISEGSSNVVKEAMACNCPIVSTDVGDVRWVIGDTEGCYICSFDPMDVAEKIKLALEFAGTKGRTNGRLRIIELGLDNKSIAEKIVEVYRKILNKD